MIERVGILYNIQRYQKGYVLTVTTHDNAYLFMGIKLNRDDFNDHIRRFTEFFLNNQSGPLPVGFKVFEKVPAVWWNRDIAVEELTGEYFFKGSKFDTAK